MYSNQSPDLNLSLLREAYRHGFFPMAESGKADALIQWHLPDIRAVLIPSAFHVPRRLARLIRSTPFEIVWNDDFRAVIEACAVRAEGSWINPPLVETYSAWAEAGEAFCLSVFQGDVRVGGIYGVQMGAVFMAESMFSKISNASSIALVVLVAGLAKAGVALIDVQYDNAHTEKFNPLAMGHDDYMEALRQFENRKIVLRPDYFCLSEAGAFIQSLSQTS